MPLQVLLAVPVVVVVEVALEWELAGQAIRQAQAQVRETQVALAALQEFKPQLVVVVVALAALASQV